MKNFQKRNATKKLIKGAVCGAIIAASAIGFSSCNRDKEAVDKGVNAYMGALTAYVGKKAGEIYTHAKEVMAEYASNYAIAYHSDLNTVLGIIGAKLMAADYSVSFDGDSIYLNTGEIAGVGSAEVWYVDGVAYVKTDEGSYKYELDIENSSYANILSAAKNPIFSLSEETLEGATVTDEEGGVAVYVTVSGEDALKNLDENLSSIEGIQLGDIEYVLHLDENYTLLGVDSVYNFKLDTLGIPLNYSYKTYSTVSGIGSTLVSLPEGDFVDKTEEITEETTTEETTTEE